MKDYIIHDEWSIIEEGFNPAYNKISESIFSIGNGRMGQRANFEEKYSGDSLQGSYVAGVYYPDKTKVGWWKNGYPEYFAKVINAPNWIGIDIEVQGETLDLSNCEIINFRRELDMKRGLLKRSFCAKLPSGNQINVSSTRFCSIVDNEAGVIRYTVSALNFSGQIKIRSYLDADIKNTDSNYDEKFWDEVSKESGNTYSWITTRTRKLDFHVCTGMQQDLTLDGVPVREEAEDIVREKYLGKEITLQMNQGSTVCIDKFAAVISSEYYPKEQLPEACVRVLNRIGKKGFEQLRREQEKAWEVKWEESDITIDGDVAAQQGIRFNIFQLNQTYTGDDPRLNIGPKGFTGEKYGGSTYWDTEAYCLPFYMSTADPGVAENLLIYRHNHLEKAIENAEKLGFTDGAALYPMVTMNGEECHNEWEITFEEIHRNGAIAYAIYDYIRYTGDKAYLSRKGLEVLIGIARFWAQRVNYSEQKKQYVILGVTGPNEYENNVNNNWHTNHFAVWCLEYAAICIEEVKKEFPKQFREIESRTRLNTAEEVKFWLEIAGNIYYPYDAERNIYLQQDGFLDKELQHVNDLPEDQVPINQHWSWDRILRSCFIKQADVLQTLYFFEEKFDMDSIKRHFDFYEPMTVHESSLSPCVHAILASKLGYHEKAYDMYLRTARLDLDDYNNDTEDGCHITSMAGTWMSVVKGFGGMRIIDDSLHFNPFIPDQWEAYSFRINFRKHILTIKVCKEKVEITNHSSEPLEFYINSKKHLIEPEANEAIIA